MFCCNPGNVSFCGGLNHKRANCPANHCLCYKCGRKGHFAKVRRSRRRNSKLTDTAVCGNEEAPELAVLSSTSRDDDDAKVNMFVLVNGILANCLLDTGAKQNHLSADFQQRANIKVLKGLSNHDPIKGGLAVKGASVKTLGCCAASVELKGRDYSNVNFSIMNGLMWDAILGRDFLSQHRSVNFNFGGPKTSLELGALKSIKGAE